MFNSPHPSPDKHDYDKHPLTTDRGIYKNKETFFSKSNHETNPSKSYW